jgi:DNA-binding transcriptional LysR family regulator
MDFRQLQYLTTVAEYQNITKAADALYISQSAMSHYIQKAEAELGIQLFDRSTTPLTLTYAGTRYMEAARKILMENEQLMKEFRDITQHMTGKLRVGTSRDRASYMMPRLIPEFSGLYPGIEIEIFTESGQQLKEALRNGRIDLLLLPANDNEDLHGFETQDIYTEELILSAKKGLIMEDFLAKGSSHVINPKALNHMPFYLLYQEHAMRTFCDSFFRKHRIKPVVKMEFSSNITCYRMSATGMAFSIIPYLTTQLTHCEQEAELFSLGIPPVTWNVQVIYRKDAYLGQPEKDFIDIAKRIFNRETLPFH